MEKIEAAERALLPQDESPEPMQGTGSLLLGLLFLAAAIPYFALRLLAGALWRDLRRVGRFVRLAGSTYSEGLAGK